MDASALVPISTISGSTSALTRSSASLASASAFASNTTPSVTKAYYPSPVFQVDTLSGVLVEVWRNTSTGEQTSQSPSKTALLYGQAQGLTSRVKTTQASSSASSGSSSSTESGASSSTVSTTTTATASSSSTSTGSTGTAAVGSTVSIVA